MTIRHTDSTPPPGRASHDPGELPLPASGARPAVFASLYLIVDPRDKASCGHDLVRVRAAFRGGVQWAQLRMKGARSSEVVRGWEQLLPLARDAGVRLIMNDHVEAAIEVGADGVHLGQSDLARTGRSIEALRRDLGEAMWVGVSTHSAAQAREALAAGADYIGFGAMFETRSKDAAVVIGPRSLEALADLRGRPVFAIGGIRLENVAEIAKRGVHRVAVSAAILGAADPERAARDFRSALSALSASAARAATDASCGEPGSIQGGAP